MAGFVPGSFGSEVPRCLYPPRVRRGCLDHCFRWSKQELCERAREAPTRGVYHLDIGSLRLRFFSHIGSPSPPSLPDPEAYLRECVSRLTREQIAAIFSDVLGAGSSQASAASEVILLPFFYVFKLAFMLLFLLRGKLVIN